MSRRGSAGVLALALLASAVAADQNDPRLARLFDELDTAPNAPAAQAVEQRIWSIWFESPGASAEQDLNLARRTAEAGDMGEAVVLFDRLVENHPDYAEGWNQRAIVRYLLGDIDGSLADIERVLALEPRHFGALSGRGQCYLRLERFGDALDAFEAALGINPWLESVARQILMLQAIIERQQTPI